MPFGYTPPSWGTSGPVSGPHGGGGIPTGGGGNRPPSERVWEEDREDETPVSVDYTRPIASIDETIQQDLPVIENLGASNLEKLLSDEERKWNFLNALQNEWVGSGSDPLYDYDENYPALGISSPYAMQGMKWDKDLSEWYSTQGGNISPAWQAASPFEVGAQLVDGEWKKPILSGLGEELLNYDWTDGGENPFGTIPNPEEIYFTKEGKPSPILEKMQGISEDYYKRGFDDWWYDDPGTPWGQEWYDYPLKHQEAAKLPHWRSEALPTESVSMGEMKPIYGRELGGEGASPIYMAGMESMTGIPYQGRPEFGTIKYGDDEFGTFVG